MNNEGLKIKSPKFKSGDIVTLLWKSNWTGVVVGIYYSLLEDKYTYTIQTETGLDQKHEAALCLLEPVPIGFNTTTKTKKKNETNKT
jgi:hypothetical protein